MGCKQCIKVDGMFSCRGVLEKLQHTGKQLILDVYIVCAVGENKSHKFIGCDGVTLVCGVAFFLIIRLSHL